MAHWGRRLFPGGVAVIKRCDVYENDLPVGSVILGRRGLYWAVSCRCDGNKGRGKRLIATEERGRIDLGLLYPLDDSFGLETSVAVKRLGEGKICFFLESDNSGGEWIALDEKIPFAYLSQLEHCRFCIRDRKKGILISIKK